MTNDINPYSKIPITFDIRKKIKTKPVLNPALIFFDDIFGGRLILE